MEKSEAWSKADTFWEELILFFEGTKPGLKQIFFGKKLTLFFEESKTAIFLKENLIKKSR
ncbi:hypothetical protein GFS24_27950 [Chitinophaga sp. SYP-B3965]|uniref:hypothetical protein n=1 Tax=Chitinophaga sp. SYP-B3965 TaxID=2663120 RepID=UPI001299BBC2|nr:hypothetical protein [Chitinophaga sp. SYP-B3965]MRG48976.1 hypothetical protein [Chitinophaga sp. SYP-B3965]